MTTSRLAILLAVLLGMGGVFFLPKRSQEQPAGVVLELPATVGEWQGTDGKITEKEIGTLGRETKFARKIYTNGRGDELAATIVLSGHDMDVSIHRPERCLPAQGFSIGGSPIVKVAVAGRGVLDTTRLRAVKTETGKDGRSYTQTTLNYYWFAGLTSTTASHLERKLIDATDRLLHGYSQHWAYFTVATNIRNGRTEKETDTLIKDFIQRVVPATHLPSVKFGK